VFEAIIAALCDGVEHDLIEWSEHYTEQIPLRQQPRYDDIRHVQCEDDPRVIEHRRNDPRGPSCLIWGIVRGRVAHVECSYAPALVLVTAYWPDTRPWKWTDNYRRRVKPAGTDE
jgi:hypothetical protein